MSARGDDSFANHYEVYDDPTGVPTPRKDNRGVTPLTTNRSGQHAHTGTTEDADAREDDLWFDTTQA